MDKLEKYTQAVGAVEDHVRANKELFDAHQKLVFALMDAENELRDAVAVTKQSISNGEFKVTVTPQTQTVYDEEKLLGALKLSREGALATGIIMDNERPPRITIGKVAKEM